MFEYKTLRRLRVWLLLALLSAVTVWHHAGIAETDGELRLGVFPRHPAQDMQRMFEPLRRYLSETLGTAVSLHTPVDYASFWAAVEAGDYDLLHYNQYHYVRGHAAFGHRLVAANEEHGRQQIAARIYVRTDSEAQQLDDLRGRKILFGGGPDAMVSYVLGTDLLRKRGLNEGDYIARFAQNPVKALIGLHYMQADAAAAGAPVIDLPTIRQQLGDGSLRVLAQGDPIPHLPWATAATVDEDRRQAIETALLDLNSALGGRAILDAMQLTGLRRASDRQYDSVREVIQRVHGEDYTQPRR